MLQPDAILASSGFAAPLVASLQDDPDSPDGVWLAADLPFSMRLSFPTPGGTLSGTQTFKVLLRKKTSEAAPDVAVSLYENGALVRLLSTTSITSDSGQVITATFNASEITNAANVEILVSGVSSAVPWTPTQLGANLVRFFHAADPALANDTAVSTWVDRTGTANLTGTTTTRPLYKTAGRNGLPSVLFDGLDDFLTGADTGLPLGATASTVLVVGFLTNGVNFGYPLAWGGTATGQLRVIYVNFNGEASCHVWDDGLDDVGNSWWNKDSIVLGYIQGGGSPVINLKVDGRTTLVDTVTVTINTPSFSLVMGKRGPDNTHYWNGHIQCAIVINKLLDATETAKLEGWAAHEFGITALLPGGHPYKTVAPLV